MQKIKELWPYFAIVVFVILLKHFVVTPIRVNGPSMEPTLEPKDIMILNRTAYWFQNPKRFDIVVVKTEEENIIKRVIGLPGETIEYKKNTLYVNGKKVKEPVKNIKTEDFTTEEIGSLTIPKGEYLVLGDNRYNSSDSRMIGFIKKSQIMGRTRLTILPFQRIGWKK